MASTDSTADVATVLALEEQVNDLRKAIKSAKPAMKRLEKATYPGAEMAAYHLESTEDRCEGGLDLIAEYLKMMREAAGDLAAWDFRFYGVAEGRETLGAAVKEMIDGCGTGVENLDRVTAMQKYAASVA